MGRIAPGANWGQTANFRQNAPEIHVSPRFAAFHRSEAAKLDRRQKAIVCPTILLQSNHAMSTDGEKSRLTVAELATRFRSEMIPLTGKFSYFSLLPIAEEDLRQYLNDPIAAISPAIVAGLPRMGVILAPYVEKGNGKGVDCATFERPAESRHIPSARSEQSGMLVLVVGVKDIEVADYHYQFYNALAGGVAERWPQDVQERFFRTIRDELSAEEHRDVAEKSWHLKQALLRRQTNVRKETKLFREYARQAFEDTLTLYLHGTCCHIVV